MRSKLLVAAGLVLTLGGCISLNPFGGAAPAPGPVAGAATTTTLGNASAGDPRIASLASAGLTGLSGPQLSAYMDQQETELDTDLRDTGVSVTRVGNQIVLNLPSAAAFQAGNATVQDQFRPVLVSIGNVLNKFDKTLVDVYGYTDSQGPEAYNLDLSQKRAVSIATMLANQGVDQRRFHIQGKGEADPVESNATEDGRARNRRVVIQIAPIVKS